MVNVLKIVRNAMAHGDNNMQRGRAAPMNDLLEQQQPVSLGVVQDANAKMVVAGRGDRSAMRMVVIGGTVVVLPTPSRDDLARAGSEALRASRASR